MRTPACDLIRPILDDVDGDYLDLTGPEDLDELRRIIETALEVSPSVWDLNGPYPWAHINPSLNIVVDIDSAGIGTARVGIADYEHDTERRHAATERLRSAFSRRPDWTVTYSTDRQ